MDQGLGVLLGGPPGTFFYHLIVLLVAEAALALSYSAHRHGRDPHALARVWAWAGILGIRTAATAWALFQWVEFNPAALSVGRFATLAETATTLLLVWGFVLAPQFVGRGRWVALALGAAACLGAAALTHPNIGWLDPAGTWLVVEAGILALGLGLVWRRVQEPWSTASFLLVLALGLGLEAASGGVGAGISSPWWRLGQIVAFPVALVTTYRLAPLQGQPAAPQPSEARSAARRWIAYFETVQRPGSTSDFASVLPRIAEGASRFLQADEGAVLLGEGPAPEVLRLAAIYNPARTGHGESVTLPLREQHVLRKALRQGDPIAIPDTRDQVQVQILLALMGASAGGPVLIVPLDLGEESSGLLILSRTQSRQPFNDTEVALSSHLAPYVCTAIQAACQHRDLMASISELKIRLRGKEVQLEEQKYEAQKHVNESKAEAELFSQRLCELEQELEEREEELKGLRLEVAQQAAHAAQSQEEAQALARKLEQTVRERIRLEKQLQQKQEDEARHGPTTE